MFNQPADLLSHFRSQMGDKVAPYFWSDSELYTYMAQVENTIAQRLLCIFDPRITVEVGTGDTDVAAAGIIRIRKASWVFTNGLDDVEHETNLDIDSFTSATIRDPRLYTRRGRPQTLLTGGLTDSFSLYPMPETDGKLVFAAYRVPLQPCYVTTRFEIPFQYRYALFEGMKMYALSKEDADTVNFGDARKAEANFENLLDGYKTVESLRTGGPQNGYTSYGGL